jgi:hypothetical protein
MDYRHCRWVSARCLERADGAGQGLADSYNLAALAWALVGLLDLLDQRLPVPSAQGAVSKGEAPSEVVSGGLK